MKSHLQLFVSVRHLVMSRVLSALLMLLYSGAATAANQTLTSTIPNVSDGFDVGTYEATVPIQTGPTFTVTTLADHDAVNEYRFALQ